jgi:uncharacterized membrane protein SpoIIM required for sporulation
MNIQRWIARQEPQWQQLDALLKQAETKGLKSLPAKEIQRLASLYRSVSADLARARTNQIGDTLIQDLQMLASRGYAQVYQGSRRQEGKAIVNFYLWELPAAMQRNWVYIALAFAIFLLAALIAWWFAWQDPTFMSAVVPQRLIAQVRDKRELWMGSILGYEPLASSGIMVNNIAVCFKAVAGGITGGLFTGYVLFLNGILIGAIASLVSQYDLAYPFWAFVFPHGSLELPAIFFAGGAGLLIAKGLLFPGKYRRQDALRIYGYEAAQLVFGLVPMLVIAGAIEGFFSPNPAIPEALKYLTGVILFVLLLQYCCRTQNYPHN